MASQYHSLFTAQGLELLREAIQNGTKLGITHMSYGDGNGTLPIPDASFTTMVNEVYRTQLNRLAPSKENLNWLEADGVIPSAVGGFNIREVALWAGNVMVAYANYPPTYKPSSDQGTAQIKTIRIVLQIDNTANFELKIDASVVMATIQSVEEAKQEAIKFTNETKIIIADSIDDLMKLKVHKKGQRAYIKSYHLGYATGWGYLYHDADDNREADNVNTFKCFSGGLWKRERKDKKHYYAVDAGVLAINGIDNTSALARLSKVLTRNDIIEFPVGTIETTDFKIPDVLITVIGKSRVSSTIKLTNKDSSIRIHEATEFKNIRIAGSGVYEHNYLLKDDRPYSTSDVDVDCTNCSFIESQYILLAKGRGVVFDNCMAWDIRLGWCHADWPENFVAGPEDNQTLEEGFRHFIFTNNRVHYCHPYFLINKGSNAKNLRGVTISNNTIEARGRFIDGYARDVLVTGNNAYWRDTTLDTFTLSGGDNINILCNNFSCVHKDEVVTKSWNGMFINLKGKVTGLKIHDNTFIGLKSHMLCINHPDVVSKEISLKDNRYEKCFISNTHALYVEDGAIDVLTVEDLPITTDIANYMPYRRKNTNLPVTNFSIRTKVYNSQYLHNFPSFFGESTKKQGIYTGTGMDKSQSILIGYFPKKINIIDKEGTFVRNVVQDFVQEGIQLTYNGITVTGAFNTDGKVYIWESY